MNYLSKQSDNDLSKVFFNSVEEMNECYGIDAELPSNLYSNADLVCYKIVGQFVYDYMGQYVFTGSGFHHLDGLGEPVINIHNEITLESEVYEDDLYRYEGCCFVYVRVNTYLGKHLKRSLLGCEFVNKDGYQFDHKRKFIHFVGSGFYVGDQDGVVSSINSILLYPDDYSDPIPYQEWVKQINKQDIKVEY